MKAAADPGQLVELLGHADVMQATPATWRMLVQSWLAGQPEIEKSFAAARRLAPELARAPSSVAVGSFGTCMARPKPRSGPPASALKKAEGLLPVRAYFRSCQYHGACAWQRPPAAAGGCRRRALHRRQWGVARGYHNLPELTREKFYPRSFQLRCLAPVFTPRVIFHVLHRMARLR